MISHLRGRIAELGRNHITLDVQGVGYRVHVPDKALKILSETKGEVNIHTKLFYSQHEGIFELFGFLKREDLDFFELLNSVSGIGPKKALNIMANIDVDDLIMAVVKGDPVYLNKIASLGEKTSQKVVLELKDKIKKAEISKYSKVDLSKEGEAIDALVSLGYSQKQAQEALKEVSKKSVNLEERVRGALKILNKN